MPYRGKHHSSSTKKEQSEETKPIDENSAVIQQFLVYQHQLDSRHDKYERLVKLSRDVTIESKRTIFLLHRINNENREHILADSATKLKDLQENKWKLIATELKDEDHYQFLRAYSPGLQEYIEAVSFYQYITDNTLIDLNSINSQLLFTVPECKIEVPPIEYLLGVADLTGELMRLAIHSVGAGDLKLPANICTFMRQIYDMFVAFEYVSRGVSKKLHVLKQSLQKVETACYNLQVRGSEVPKHMLAEMMSSTTSDFSEVEAS